MHHSPSRRRLIQAGALSALSLTLPAARAAEVWPSRAVRFLVPFAPGGTSEIVARSVAAELTKQLGQNVFVENKPGGAGTIAMLETVRSAPDGHTLILGHVGTLAVNPYMLNNQPYDVNKDFIPVTLLAKVPNLSSTRMCQPRISRNSLPTPRKIPGAWITAQRATAAPATWPWNT